MNFEWDPRKEATNVAKHGVSFETAKQAFSDPNAIVAYDPEHGDAKELRWWLLGKVQDRVMLVRYTQRPSGVIRIIGAGYWRKGKDLYEKAHRKE